MTCRLPIAVAILLVACHAQAEPATNLAAIELVVDARDAPRRVLHATLAIPVQPGPLTLAYPKWLPGTHSPSGPVADMAGLRISAGGQPVAWQRDSVDLYSFRMVVPAGVGRLDVAFDMLSGLPDGKFSTPASMTTELALVKWSQLALYPAGVNIDEVMVVPAITLPEGWQFATALRETQLTTDDAAGTVRFAPVSLTTLVDSTLLAGRHFRQLTLDNGAHPVSIAIAADSPEALRIPAATEASLRQLVREADALFGARHFRRYVFLVALSELVAQYGLESHESSENRLPEASLTNPALGMLTLSVLPHEYVHSWNGKYRRPAGLATPNFQAPMQGDLLWVYEGLTQYLGHLLAARSGLWTAERYRDRLAHVVAYYSQQPGRRWRPLADTAVAAQQLGRASPQWRSYRRSVDYYSEGALVWLEADMLIREATRGRRSLDDFCKLFFAGTLPGNGSPPPVVPYTEDDLYAALNSVLAHDWRGFFAARVTATNPPAPVGGVELGGWRVGFAPARNAFLQDIESYDSSGLVELSYSLGLRLNGDGAIDDIFLGSPADVAGLTPGMQLRAVNGRRFTASRLREAIEAAAEPAGRATNAAPLSLLVEYGDRFVTYNVGYAGGLKEPRLERLPSVPDRLGASIRPRSP